MKANYRFTCLFAATLSFAAFAVRADEIVTINIDATVNQIVGPWDSTVTNGSVMQASFNFDETLAASATYPSYSVYQSGLPASISVGDYNWNMTGTADLIVWQGGYSLYGSPISGTPNWLSAPNAYVQMLAYGSSLIPDHSLPFQQFPLGDYTDATYMGIQGSLSPSQGAVIQANITGYSVTTSSVPDSGTTAALLGAGMIGLFALRRKFARA